jgi:alkanesulfonate monooxygenase SsuD/methylene tetrahydromethanopterin reductase-like flavin-dependent oxidoreductase (luciferase family)
LGSVRIGFGVPRYIGDHPSAIEQPDHLQMLRYAQRAERLGFDSVWVPDHFYFESPPGAFEPYPEAWTLMTAIGTTTERVQVGSLVLAAGFRHPALLAKMAGALQELTCGRLLLGVGAGNQLAEHTVFGLGFEGRVGRFAEYLQILSALLAGERVTVNGRFYTLTDASLLMTHAPVPIWVAASGERMLGLAARYASGWNGGGSAGPDGEPFRSRVAALRQACQKQGRNPDEIEISYTAQVLVVPDARAAADVVETIAAGSRMTPERVRSQFVIGTPDEIVERFATIIGLGASHLICSIGGRMFTLWSDAMLERFASDVLPRLRQAVAYTQQEEVSS